MSEPTSLTPEVLCVDAQDTSATLVKFIQDEFTRSKHKGIVVPISGGLDSSTVAALCVQAVGKDKVLGLMLPERWGNPEANRCGRLIAAHLGIRTRKLNITPILLGMGTLDPFLTLLSGRRFWKDKVEVYLRQKGSSTQRIYLDALENKLTARHQRTFARINARQRARVLATYRIAEEQDLLVAGCANRTEQSLGLFVKYGIDDCADIMPLKNILRSHLLQVAEFLNLPEQILRRTPNPDILPGVTDKYESYLEMDYQKADLIIFGMAHGMHARDIAFQLGLDEQKVIQVQEMIRLSEKFRQHALSPELLSW